MSHSEPAIYFRSPPRSDHELMVETVENQAAWCRFLAEDVHGHDIVRDESR